MNLQYKFKEIMTLQFVKIRLNSYFIHIYVPLSRLTIVSREAKKKQAVRNERVSYLHLYSTALKFVNALNKPPLKLSLSYQGLSTF